MLKLLDAEDILEHLIQLVFAEDQLRSCAGGHALLSLSGILVAAVDGVKFSHPGAKDCFLTQTIDLWEASHSFLNVPLEDFSEIVG